MKANCPLLTSRPVQASAPTTLWIMDGRQERYEELQAKGRAYQLTVEEPKVALDIVTGMCLFIFQGIPTCLYLFFA